MAVKVDVHYSRSIDSARSPQETFSFCADMEKTIPACFPGVEKFEKTAPNTYRWIFEKIGYSGHELQIKLVTKINPKEPERLELSSLPEPGASQIKGAWKIVPQDGKSKLSFDVDLQLELPIPFLLKAVAAPIAQKELTKIFDRYLANVAKALA